MKSAWDGRGTAAVFRNVRELAVAHAEGLEHLPHVVETTYRTLVAALIASEQGYFDETEVLDDTK